MTETGYENHLIDFIDFHWGCVCFVDLISEQTAMIVTVCGFYYCSDVLMPGQVVGTKLATTTVIRDDYTVEVVDGSTVGVLHTVITIYLVVKNSRIISLIFAINHKH